MEKFIRFKIKDQKVFFGGGVGMGYQSTTWENTSGTESGTDYYNADAGIIHYI